MDWRFLLLFLQVMMNEKLSLKTIRLFYICSSCALNSLAEHLCDISPFFIVNRIEKEDELPCFSAIHLLFLLVHEIVRFFINFGLYFLKSLSTTNYVDEKNCEVIQCSQRGVSA